MHACACGSLGGRNWEQTQYCSRFNMSQRQQVVFCHLQHSVCSQLSRLLASETLYALEIVSGLIPFPGY